MAYDVHISVVFACDNNDGVAIHAKRHLENIKNILPTPEIQAQHFLESLASRTGPNPGPKGGVSTWGTVGNYTNAHSFVQILVPFWTDLLAGEMEGPPLEFEHIIVFYENQGSKRANCFEIYRENDDNDSKNTNIIIKHHQLPFGWHQY